MSKSEGLIQAMYHNWYQTTVGMCCDLMRLSDMGNRP